MAGSIRQAPKTQAVAPSIHFQKSAFDKLIDDKGYWVKKYDAVRCPCKSNGQDNLSSCENCLGLGYVFVNPIRMKAILTSINSNTQYKYWSPEFIGTIALTVKDTDSQRISLMDKIVLEDQTTIYSEIRPIRTNVSQKFIFTSYPIEKINVIFLFNGTGNALTRLTEDQYSISEDNPYVVKLNSEITYPTNFNNVVSIDYEHLEQYNVQDIPHNIRSSSILDSKGKPTTQQLPVQAICRKSEYFTGDAPEYDGTGIKDNSWL